MTKKPRFSEKKLTIKLKSAKDNLLVLQANCPILWVILPISLLLSAYFLYEHSENSKTFDSKVQNGTIISRKYTQLGVLLRPYVTVRVNKTNTIVHAVLSMDSINELPSSVTFYYSGDPNREVYLQQETSALLIGLLFFLLPIFALLMCKYYKIFLKSQIKKLTKRLTKRLSRDANKHRAP